LILDLDETLVHSSFKYVPHVDIILPIEIEGKQCDIYVLKRPGVDEFLLKMSEIFELVIFTASLSKVRTIFILATIRYLQFITKFYFIGINIFF